MSLSLLLATRCDDLPLWQRAAIAALVVLIHIGVAMLCWQQADLPKARVHEMSVFFFTPTVERTAPPQPDKRQAAVAPAVREHVTSHDFPAAAVAAAPLTINTPKLVDAAPTVLTSVHRVAESIPDSAPDYQAVYLHNPRPAYPVVAQRMGWQGRVILNVEVLSDGLCGAISVARSSGHEILDAAAIAAVQAWRFNPASHAGQAVTQWFKVPINFALEESDA